MKNKAVVFGAGALVLALMVSPFACSGEEASTTQNPVAEASEGLTDERIATSWAVQYAKTQSFEQYHGQGWAELANNRNLRAAAENGATARAHAEAAAMFKQAALMSGNAAIETYAKTPQPTDPVGAAHLLTVGYALNGELDKAREASARLDGVDDVTSAWHGPWREWLSAGGAWPPDLSSLPIELPEPTPGTWPTLGNALHYKLPIQDAESDLEQDMGDPGSLVALALWHEAAAVAASSQEAVDVFGARYRLPAEPPVKGANLEMDFLYASDFLVPEDGAFMADLMGESGVGAVDVHKRTSLTAFLVDQSRVNGKVSAEKGSDVAMALRKKILDLSLKQTDMEPQFHHRKFADMAQVGLLRNLAFVAEVEGDRTESGKLRLAARDVSGEHTGCPVNVLSLAAWDASNRYPSRAQEIVHRNSNFYPSLEVARYGLDVLALRVSREQVQTPGL